MVKLLGIDPSQVVIWTSFEAVWQDECWVQELQLIEWWASLCPDGEDFTLTNAIRGNVPAWCYDWSEVVTFTDINLLPHNIKNGVTIFWVTGTFVDTWYADGNNISAVDQILVGIPNALYQWDETITFTVPSILPQNIKSGVNIFGVTWTYQGENDPLGMNQWWYHTGITLSWGGWLSPWAPYGNAVYVAQKACKVWGDYIYFIFSCSVSWGNMYWHGYQRFCACRWNSLTQVFEKHYMRWYDGWTHYGALWHIVPWDNANELIAGIWAWWGEYSEEFALDLDTGDWRMRFGTTLRWNYPYSMQQFQWYNVEPILQTTSTVRVTGTNTTDTVDRLAVNIKVT